MSLYSSSSYSLPHVTRESEKDADYHRSVLDHIISRSLNSTFSVDYSVMDACYKAFDTGSNPQDFTYLQQAPDSTVLPAQWQSINKIFPKVMVLLGELMERGYDFEVKAINKSAKARKLEAKEEARVMMRLEPILRQLDAHSGLQGAMPELPPSSADLDEFFDKRYKDQAEIVMYYALKFLDKKNDWGYERMSLFRDLLIAGKCIVRNYIKNGIPCADRVDPRFFIFDTFTKDDFASDSTYYGELEYMPLAQAAQEFNLTIQELTEANEKYQDFLRIQQAKSGATVRNQELNAFDSLNQASGLRWFRDTSGGLRVLVCRAYWMDQKKFKTKDSEDSYGTIHTKRMKSDSQDREGVTSRTFKVWRQGTLVGGKFLKDWGLMENQARDTEPEKHADAYPPYTVLLPNFLNGRSVSPVERTRGLQNLKDIITYQVQLAMARSGSRGFVYDVAQCPDDWDVDTVIKYLKTVGIAFINSRQGGTPSNFNQFQQFDLSISQSVDQFINLSRWIDEEMDSVFGVNEARQGVVQGASQAVGVTRSALLQSSLTTAPYFHLFSKFSSRVWNHQAKLVKIAWANKETFAPILGDAGVDFLTNDIELDLDDYGVFIEETPKLLDDLASFQQLVMAALSAGQVNFKDALLLLRNKDVMEAIREFEKVTAQNEAKAQEQQMQLMQQEAAMKAEGEARANEFNARQADIAARRAVAQQQQKARDDKELELMQQRGDLQQEKLKLMGNGAAK